MSQFEMDNAVFFIDEQGEHIDTTVVCSNKKTQSLVTDHGDCWNIAPVLCGIERKH